MKKSFSFNGKALFYLGKVVSYSVMCLFLADKALAAAGVYSGCEVAGYVNLESGNLEIWNLDE
ncbi:MAG: hypothetical protein KA479_04985 [Saprospiraceae bacterium]|jgi:hypothetical protein|nr:hypothetical protein [Saprospiraceae bacterium]